MRYLIPAIEILVSVALVIVPLWHYSVSCCTLRTPSGEERIVWHDNPPPLPSFFGIDAVKFSEGMNLPAIPIVLPVLLLNNEYREGSRDWIHDQAWRGIGFALGGIVAWFFVGRFIDDLLGWRRVGLRGRVFDLLFASTTAITATLAATYTQWTNSAFTGRETIWFAVWIFLWGAAGYSGAIIRVVQLLRARPKVNEP